MTFIDVGYFCHCHYNLRLSRLRIRSVEETAPRTCVRTCLRRNRNMRKWTCELPTYDTNISLSPPFPSPPLSASLLASPITISHTVVFSISHFAALTCSAFLRHMHRLRLCLFGFNAQHPTDKVHASMRGRDLQLHPSLSRRPGGPPRCQTRILATDSSQ